MEALEDRTVPTLTLGSALSLGNATGASVTNDVATDAVGNSYMTGYFSGTTDFDTAHTYPGNPGILTARGDNDIFVAKYAPDGSLVWAKRMGGDALMVEGAFTDMGNRITVDGGGNVYVTGEFIGSADFGSTTLSTAGDRDGFVAKLNPSGTVLWARQWGTAVDNRGQGIGVDTSGNVYAAIQAAGGSGATNGVDVLKYTSAGTLTWSDWINSRMFLPFDLAVSTSGNVFVSGSFSGTVDFDPSPKTCYANSGYSGLYSSFALNLNTNGKFGWVCPFVGLTDGSSHGYSGGDSIALDGSGNVVVGGFYRGPVDFNPGSATATLPSIGGGFIAKVNPVGGLVWAKALESAGTAHVFGLAVDATGSIYSTGQFSGTVDFDPGLGTAQQTSVGANNDMFILKLDAAGAFKWDTTFGAAGYNVRGNGIAVDPSGTVHLAGRYTGSVDFDPDTIGEYWLTNPGDLANAFFVLLRQS